MLGLLVIGLAALETQVLSVPHHQSWLKALNLVFVALGIAFLSKVIAHRYRDVPLPFSVLATQIAVLVGSIAYLLNWAHTHYNCSGRSCGNWSSHWILVTLILIADSLSIVVCALLPRRTNTG
jgi:hypothetical protein